MIKDDEMIGKMFGRWKVLEKIPNKNKHVMFKCECQCENKTIRNVDKCNLVSGKSISCGCYRREQTSKAKKKYNAYDLSGDYGVGYTETGYYFFFDLEDYDKIKNYCWHEDTDGYITANINKNDKYTTVKMHRIIMGVINSKEQVDHIKHKKYDNRKSELRIVTNELNQRNKRILDSNTSGVTGVCFYRNKWNARIDINNKTIHLGAFDLFEDAVKARKEAEEKYYGEYSYDNSMNQNLKEGDDEDDLF